jgi:dolichol-phosphate mannosyltransferase
MVCRSLEVSCLSNRDSSGIGTKGGDVVSVSNDLSHVSAATNVGLPGLAVPTADRTAELSLQGILQKLELQRERRWHQGGKATELKLHWRAKAIQHMLDLVPGESILELGAGSGLLTKHLDSVLHGENPITSIVFSQELFEQAALRRLSGVKVLAGDCLRSVPSGHYDYVIGAGMLWHSDFAECQRWIYSALKPGGQILFFEPSFYWPSRFFNELRSRAADFKKYPLEFRRVMKVFEDTGFKDINLTPYDIVSARLGVRLMAGLQAKAILLEHMPGVNHSCVSMCVRARKQGQRIKPEPNLADQRALFGAVSVVVPAHNEAANVDNLVTSLLHSYGDYIHEIIVVNDNSTDFTAQEVAKIALSEPRVRLVNRSMPNGVGLALKDGYRAATGRYILSMDCDFVQILPQFRSLFRIVAEGHDGAIGSRFSHDSVLLNYPFAKLLFNRLCHILIKMFLVDSARDITNNLKLYRSEIFKSMDITSPHFSANLETGLKPLLAGYDIVEVSVSWINRTSDMGSSTFSLRRVGMSYARALLSCWRENRSRTRGWVPLAWRQFRKTIQQLFLSPNEH